MNFKPVRAFKLPTFGVEEGVAASELAGDTEYAPSHAALTRPRG
jgi:hypothetical protein